MDNINDEDLLQKIKDACENLASAKTVMDYPKEALPLGTWVRSHRLDRLGVVTDAFYGELDVNSQKIIIYTVLLFPKMQWAVPGDMQNTEYHMSNEYEYEVTAFLMINPVNLKSLTKQLGGLVL